MLWVTVVIRPYPFELFLYVFQEGFTSITPLSFKSMRYSCRVLCTFDSILAVFEEAMKL